MCYMRDGFTEFQIGVELQHEMETPDILLV
jgi:hypothetical protein